MQKEWFVLHTLTGQEYKVKESIMRRLKQEEVEEYFGEIIVPTELVSEVRHGVKTTTTRKFYPGYVLIEVALYDESRKIREKPWYFIKDTPGVIGFVGGNNPVPLTPSEVEQTKQQMAEKADKAKPKVVFEPGETVKINDGPFINFTGVVEEVDTERGKLKVSVAIFGRTAPVELEYWQVEKVV
jgi:transcriptional antiterminator NusG